MIEIPVLNTSIDNIDTKAYDEVVDSFNEFNMAVSYIIDYMCQHMAPHLCNIKSTGKIIKSINDSYDFFLSGISAITDAAKESIQNISSEDNIKTYAEANNLKELNSKINTIKDSCISDLLIKRQLSDYQYYSYDGTVESVDLLPIYEKELEEFIDDETNIFVKELKISIREFIAIRKSIGTSNIKSLSQQAENEIIILNSIADRAISAYNKYHDSIMNLTIFDKLKECSWESCGQVYDNDIKHDYYFITINDEESNDNENNRFIEAGFPEETTTAVEITKLNYWLKYLGIATLMNLSMPQYWSTGFVGPNGPVSLPVIMFPIFSISGRVIAVFGLGICGMYPYPLILLANTGTLPACIILPINTIIDMIQDKLKEFASKSVDELMGSAAMQLEAINQDIIKCENDIEEINKEIEQIANLSKSKAAKIELEENKKRKSL